MYECRIRSWLPFSRPKKCVCVCNCGKRKMPISTPQAGLCIHLYMHVYTCSTFDQKRIENYGMYYIIFQHDYASISLGTITNSLSDTGTESSSQIEILFEATAINHPDLTEGDLYRISVGATFDSSTITIAQDDLQYDADEPSYVSLSSNKL